MKPFYKRHHKLVLKYHPQQTAHKDVGAACRYSDLSRAGWSGDRIPMGVRFFAPVQTAH